MDRLQRIARDKHAPNRLVSAERRLANTVMASLMHDDAPDRWTAILLAAVEVERLQATGCGFDAGPIPPLSPEWLAACGDGTEMRLAAALGSAAAEYTKARARRDSVRHHWLPLEPGALQFRVSKDRLANDPRVVATGRDALADFAVVVQRRITEASMLSQRRLPLVSAPGFGATLSDLALLLGGSIDLDRVADLARALMPVRWNAAATVPRRESVRRESDLPPEPWLALRLASLPWPLSSDRIIPCEGGIVRRLLADDSAGAVGLALARLRSAGIRPPIQGGATNKYSGRRWAAALVFPIDRTTALRAAAVLDPSLKGLRYA
jgi:CRISPR-associated protein Csx17